jgi:hypothetical protein
MVRTRTRLTARLTVCAVYALHNIAIAWVICRVKRRDAVEVAPKAVRRYIDQLSWAKIIAPGVVVYCLTPGFVGVGCTGGCVGVGRTMPRHEQFYARCSYVLPGKGGYTREGDAHLK